MTDLVTHISRHPAFTPDVRRLEAGHEARARIEGLRKAYLDAQGLYAEIRQSCWALQEVAGPNLQAQIQDWLAISERQFIEARRAYHAVRETEHAVIDMERAA